MYLEEQEKASNNFVDYTDDVLSHPITVNRTVTSTGGARIAVENRQVSKELEIGESVSEVVVANDDVMFDSVVAETPMESQNGEFTDSIVPETPMESQNGEFIDGSNSIVEMKGESEVKISMEKGVIVEMKKESDEKYVVNDDEMFDSIVPKTAMESQNGEFIDGLSSIAETEEESEVKSSIEKPVIVEMKEECDDMIVKKEESNEKFDVLGFRMENQKPEEFVIEGSKTEIKVKEEPFVGSKRKVDCLKKMNDGKKESEIEEKRRNGPIGLKDGEFPEEKKLETEILPDGCKKIVNVEESDDKFDVLRFRMETKKAEEFVFERSKTEIKVKEEPFVGSNRKSDCLKKMNDGKKESSIEEKRRNRPVGLEDGDFPEEADWLPIGDGIVEAQSTTRGRKLEMHEIVDLKFPLLRSSSWIVRFGTKRSGEIGRLPMNWSKCLIPLVSSSKVKVRGRYLDDPTNLYFNQNIMLSLRCYIHKSVPTSGDKISWRLDGISGIEPYWNPLLNLFRLLKIKPFQEAECIPKELESQKRSLSLQGQTEIAAARPVQKRRTSGPQLTENNDEQSISESTLNKIVGAAEIYDLEEMEPPNTLMCDLRPYQKQALYWMCRLESKEEAAYTLHPYYAEYRICNRKAIYVNTFSGEATMKMPTATDSARGGVSVDFCILADAMGLGKTVMAIALIHARLGRGILGSHRYAPRTGSSRAKGGTLIICPMTLLCQWKDELETHSALDSLSVFVHYGGDRTNDPCTMANHDVVLTTFGVLSSAYKSYGENSIYHRVDWRRVVLDEAHTIKAWKTLTAQAAFALSSHSRWCLTGTPLQNSLEDLYSLFCFLKVEPWCNWNCWRNTIQRPYESGDPSGLKYVKAILRPLMLRRSKESKDKEGRLILELPPTDIRTIVCQQSEAEHDFYDALFRRSKVQFGEFLAQGKVLHNYASILELLLRLRQCCNHPFLVMRRKDSQNWDFHKLAKRFLESHVGSPSSFPSPAAGYIQEVMDTIQNGDITECPICLEYADDPVLTPCAHKMCSVCRECLLRSWRNPATGTCPLCRRTLHKTELLACPSSVDNGVEFDVEEKWKDSSKVAKLLECLEDSMQRRKIGFLRFDGQLSMKQRERVLREFNESRDKMVMLMSLKAGGVGLNLTAASNVFLMDPWWNPAVEEQAIIRIHRIGQKRTVQVRRFIVKDTVEERLQQVQAKKQNMIAGALTDEDVRSSRLEDLKMLFR